MRITGTFLFICLPLSQPFPKMKGSKNRSHRFIYRLYSVNYTSSLFMPVNLQGHPDYILIYRGRYQGMQENYVKFSH